MWRALTLSSSLVAAFAASLHGCTGSANPAGGAGVTGGQPNAAGGAADSGGSPSAGGALTMAGGSPSVGGAMPATGGAESLGGGTPTAAAGAPNAGGDRAGSDAGSGGAFGNGGNGTAGAAAGAAGGGCEGAVGEVLAFPGAEGFGKLTLGGRLGDVYHVTSLEDSGSGSLREGVTTATGPRTIVFDVSGTIALASNLEIRGKSKLTLAGQTAPGDGITLRNHALYIRDSQHIVVRYIRSRLGDTAGLGADAASVISSSNVVFDHCSLSWSTDSVFDLTHSTGLVSVQWCILSEALNAGNHAFAAGWDGKGAGGGSYHHNLLASCASRMPRVDGVDPAGLPGPLVDIRNNVIYNWGDGDAYGGEFANINFVNNYLKPGPSSTKLGWLFEMYGSAGQIFVSGNFVDGQPGITGDNATGVINLGVVPTPFSVVDVPTQTAAAAYDSVLEHVGASKIRDAVDLRIVADVRNRTGQIINSQNDVGAWPALASTPPPLDTDRDGMPDAWEMSRSLDPKNPADGNGDLNCDGYTNLEDYLNGLVSG